MYKFINLPSLSKLRDRFSVHYQQELPDRGQYKIKRTNEQLGKMIKEKDNMLLIRHAESLILLDDPVPSDRPTLVRFNSAEYYVHSSYIHVYYGRLFLWQLNATVI